MMYEIQKIIIKARNRIIWIWRKLTEHKRFEREILYSIYFNQITQDSTWLHNRSFALGRWAVDYCFLFSMYKAIEASSPSHILDLGLGQTTRMLSQYVDWANGGGNNVTLTTIEHDPSWIDYYRKAYGISMYADIIIMKQLKNVPYQLSNKVSTKEANLYDGFEDWLDNAPKFDLISIDAPFGNVVYSRMQVFDILRKDKLADDFVIMMDDVFRYGEMHTINLLYKELKKKGVKCYKRVFKGEKMHCMLVSEKYRFLIS